MITTRDCGITASDHCCDHYCCISSDCYCIPAIENHECIQDHLGGQRNTSACAGSYLAPSDGAAAARAHSVGVESLNDLCMFLCMYACVYVCVCVYQRIVCMHVCLHVSMYVPLCVYKHVMQCMHVRKSRPSGVGRSRHPALGSTLSSATKQDRFLTQVCRQD